MPESQVIVVSLPGSGTPLLADLTSALGYLSYGTMSTAPAVGGRSAGSPEIVAMRPLLTAAHGREEAELLLKRGGEEREELDAAFREAAGALWRVWWMRLGQPVAVASSVDPGLESRLARVPERELPGLLPGRGCWYVDSLGLQRADAGFLRAWQKSGRPPVVFHHRDVRDRIVSQIRSLSRPGTPAGYRPHQLIYRDIVAALPTMDAKITFALTDPGFPGMEEARRCQWLLHHPAVTVITHEDLAGPAHGGTAEGRERAVAQLLAITGLPPSAAASAASAQPPRENEELTVGQWRNCFTPAHERLLDRRHGDLLTARAESGPADDPTPETAREPGTAAR
ncbi:hypothetical protein ACIBBB_34340 [Streptomyces sp. NPDC051217]|uniref:hypothetical protein n=1 Tax=Streptomyces sp. NPDC051217 TaxID=3365644 RepID=UPI0037A9AAB0